MKITWFGASVFRLHIGGRIVVTDAEQAPDGLDPAEIAAGADERVVFADLTSRVPPLPAGWRPSRPRRVVDETAAPSVRLFTLADRALLVDEADEGPVILAPAEGIEWNRAVDDAVVVLFGTPQTVTGEAVALLDTARPRLVALATPALDDPQFAHIADTAGRTAVQLLEPGLAVEA